MLEGGEGESHSSTMANTMEHPLLLPTPDDTLGYMGETVWGGDCFEEKLREGSKSSSSSSSSSSSHSSERSILACVLVGGLYSPSFLTSHHFLKNPPIWGESGQFSPSWSSSCSVFPHHCWTSLSVDTEPSYLHLLYTPIIHGMHSVRPARERRVLYRVISTSDKRDMEGTKE